VNWFSCIVIYLTIWWTVLFAILPLGTTSYHEAGVTPPRGCDPASPMDPKLKRKFITTSWVSAIIFGVMWAVYASKLFHLPSLPG
jgi:predicted secreted protein